jgi:hypothetical protein
MIGHLSCIVFGATSSTLWIEPLNMPVLAKPPAYSYRSVSYRSAQVSKCMTAMLDRPAPAAVTAVLLLSLSSGSTSVIRAYNVMEL